MLSPFLPFNDQARYQNDDIDAAFADVLAKENPDIVRINDSHRLEHLSFL